MKENLHPASQAALARALGIGRQIIQHHRKNTPDAPKGLNEDEWKAFLASKNHAGSTPKDIHMALAEVKLAKERIKLANDQDARAMARGELLYFVEVSEILSRLVGTFSTELDRLAQELPPNLVGLTAPQMAMKLKQEKDVIKRKTLEMHSEWVAEQEAKSNVD